VIERTIDFMRRRRMRCGSCQHEWPVTAEWIDRFNQALETCPACGTDCQGEDRPDFCVAPDEPLHNDDVTREHYWYHSSTHSNWPDKDFDPAAGLTEITKRRMETASGPRGAVERWAGRQKSKALHLGSYEAAIENMFRRMRNQGDNGAQFYLYRVQLTRDCVIEPGIHPEPTNWLGDANLADVCRPDVQVLRYVNVHEDPSNVSIAIELNAIHAVQGMAMPLQIDASDTRIVEAIARLRTAASEPPPPPEGKLQRLQWHAPSPLTLEARRLETEISAGLPPYLKDTFSVGFNEADFESNPAIFAVKLIGLAHLVTDPQAILRALDAQPWRKIVGSREGAQP
jgi:hypothetical protein